MKLKVVIFLATLNISLNAQENISVIKSALSAINGKQIDLVYKQDTSQFGNQIRILNSDKSRLTSELWYLDFEPSDYQRKNLIKYNQISGSFPVSHQINGDIYFDKAGFIQFDMILLRCPDGLIIDTKNTGSSCVGLIDETISFKIDNDSLVTKIEKNKSNLRLLFVFNFTGTSLFTGTLSDPAPASYYLLTELRKVIVYNSGNGEIYFAYD
jgi:hypothetical protein